MLAEKCVVEGNGGVGVYYKRLRDSFHLNESTIQYNHEQGVFIDSCRTGYEKNGYVHQNTIKQNRKSGLEVRNTHYMSLFKNEVTFNDLNGIWSYRSHHVYVTFSKIKYNKQTGIWLEDGGHFQSGIENNEIWYNDTGVRVVNSTISIYDNNYKGNRHNTGIHLDNAGGIISGNVISEDDGDGIACENGSQPTITGNNIMANAGLGVNNMDASVTVNAAGNWWGDASGPGGSGAGTGDEVSANVTFGNWLAEPVTLSGRAELDTLRIAAGLSDSVYCSFRNMETPEGGVDVTLTDTQGWLTAASLSGNFTDSLGVRLRIPITVPAEAAPGAESWVKLTAALKSNATKTVQDSFLVITYQQALVRIQVTPDSVFLLPGETRLFEVTGYDSLNNTMAPHVRWTATGGTINAAGLFTAGVDTGYYQITATDTVQGLTDQVVIHIGAYTHVSQNTHSGLPKAFSLDQNYPNPFNPVTTIGFSVKERCKVSLIVYDILGRKVKALVDDDYAPGYYQVSFNASQIPTGMYVYRIVMKDFTDVKKMIITK
jgi:parallel beta-helix repeat protein